jgi:hypothetical protein
MYLNETIISRYIYFFDFISFAQLHASCSTIGKPYVREKKREKTTKKRKNMPTIEREEPKTPSMRQYKWVTLIYFILPYKDVCSKAQGGVS